MFLTLLVCTCVPTAKVAIHLAPYHTYYDGDDGWYREHTI
jgi:hypothetical protein